MKKQWGTSFLSFIFSVMVVSYIVLLAFRFIPVYVENYIVSSILESLPSEFQRKELNDSQIINMIERRLDINNVKSVSSKEFRILREGNGTIVAVEYKVPVKIIADIEMVADFSESIEMGH